MVEVNRRQHERMVEKIRALAGGSLDGVPIALWGLTFKANTDDLRDSPALVIVRRLLEEGAIVRAYDPAAGERAAVARARARGRRRPYDACEGAAVLAVLTEWDEFRWLDFDRVAAALAAPRACSTPATCSTRSRCGAAGFTYEGVGVVRIGSPAAGSVVTGRRRLPRVAPLRAPASTAAGTSSGSTTCSPGGWRTCATCCRDAEFTFEHTTSRTSSTSTGAVDAVLHFASPASPPDYLEHPIKTMKVGALGTHNTLGLALAKGARFLLASTSEVYGDPLVHPQPETTGATSTRSGRAASTTRRSGSPRR